MISFNTVFETANKFNFIYYKEYLIYVLRYKRKIHTSHNLVYFYYNSFIAMNHIAFKDNIKFLILQKLKKKIKKILNTNI